MPHRVTSILISRHETHQVAVSLRADRIAGSLEALIDQAWTAILRDIAEAANFIALYQRIRIAMRRLPDDIFAELRQQLESMIRWSYRQNRRSIIHSVPLDYLRHAALNKIKLPILLGPGRHLSEDVPVSGPGIVSFGPTALGLVTTALFRPDIPPVLPAISVEQHREDLESLLFPPPPGDWVQQVLGVMLQYQSWYQSMQAALRAADFGPERLATQIASDYTMGKTQAEIAENARPFVDGVRWRAARVARTFGLAVANETQRQMHAQLGDLVVGQMIRATLDERTRVNHRLRNGTIYHKQPDGSFLSDVAVPGPPKKLLREMPHPPLEGDGTLAFNCRCHTIVLLAPPSWLKDNDRLKVFRDNAGNVIPDPAVYSDWFEAAPERARRLAVGSRRYSAAKAIHGDNLRYSQLVNPDTGRLLSPAQLKNESPQERTERVLKVEQQAAGRRQDIAHLATYGFLPQIQGHR